MSHEKQSRTFLTEKEALDLQKKKGTDMNIAEAKTLAAPLITSEAAAEWAMLDTDWSIWVEYNIMAPAGISASITTAFGRRVSDWIEGQLHKKHMEDLLES